jgi:2-polyprenyl-3-methyl-5-hydroxy-6-metoxy-1,4-benzoquinol methylase
MLQGAHVTAVVGSAIELGVFATIARGARDADAIARAIECPVRSTQMVVDALSVLGLLVKQNEAYRLSPLAEVHLVPDSPMYMGGIAEIFNSATMWQNLAALKDAVRAGGTVQHSHAETPQNPFWEIFARSSTVMALPGAMGAAAVVKEHLAARPRARVLDVAAGSGMYGLTVARENPNVELTLLDWPNVLVETRRTVERIGIEPARVRYLEGNLFDLEWAGPYDVILLSHIFHHFEADVCQRLMGKVAGALGPSGYAVVHDFLTDQENPAGRMFSITMLAWTRKGQAFGSADYRRWFVEAGLRPMGVQPIPEMPTALLSAQKPA